MNKTLVKIKDFSLLSTKEMYNSIEGIRELTALKEGALKPRAEELGLSINFNTNINIKKEFYNRHGFTMDCARLFSSDQQRTLVWYKIKESIPNYYELSSATCTDNHVKTCSKLYSFDFVTLQKEFKNGNCLYEPTEDLLFSVHLVNQITANFKGI